MTGLEAGGLIAVPGYCRFSLIGTVLPGQSIDTATSALEAALHAALPKGIELEERFFRLRVADDHARRLAGRADGLR